MDSCQRENTMNVEVDRLSSLPDDLIHKIVSLNGLKRATGTSVLSSRWRYVWTSIPCLDFSTEDYLTLPKFSEYVTNVLSRRNNQVEVFSVKLRFSGDVSQAFFKEIMNYAFSHNIQQLDVTCLVEEKSIEFPLSLFNSQSLKHLTLKKEYVYRFDNKFSVGYDLTTALSNLELPALTTLDLGKVNLCCDDTTDNSVGIFSKCPNLRNLTLDSCKMIGLKVLSICHPLLSNLTLDDVQGSVNIVNVAAPQLKNLTIRNCFWDQHPYVIFTPDLASFLYRSSHPLCLYTNGFHSLEKVDLCVSCRYVEDAPKMLRLLQQLHKVKFLTLSLEILEVLSSSVELISNQPSPFANLKSLKIYPRFTDERDLPKEKVNITEVKNYLLNSSPSATFTMVTREDIIAKKNTELAQKYMDNLRVRLEWEKAMTETNTGHMDRGKTPIESNKTKTHEQHITRFEYLMHIEETVTRIDTCWEGLNRQIEEGKSNISDIISDLHDIKEVLAKLPTSYRDELQPCFSSVCSKADTIVNQIMDHVMTLCDMKQSRFSAYIQGLATTSLPSF